MDTLGKMLNINTGYNPDVASNQGVSQDEQQSESDNTGGSLFNLNPGSADPKTTASADKTDTDRMKLLFDISKAGQTPSAVQSEQFKLGNQPDSPLVNQESQDLQNFLHQLFNNISGNPIPNKDLYQLDPQSIQAAGAAQKNVTSRLTAVEQALKEIPVNPTSGIPKTMANYYNSLLVERNLLNNLGKTLSTVNAKNPYIPSSAIHSILNQAQMFGQSQGADQKNPYGLGSDAITQAILTRMGPTVGPEMKTLQDWQGYSQYIDKFMQPFIARATSLSNPQGGSLGDVNKRLAYNSESAADKNKAMEQAAGQGLANFVNLTQTLDPKLRNQLWNMFPIWAASQGLNWQNIKKYGVDHAEKLIGGPTPPDNNPTPTTSLATKATPQAIEKPKESKVPGWMDQSNNLGQSRLGSFLEGAGKVAKNVGQGAEQGLQALAAPEAAAANYLLDPSKPGAEQSLETMEPSFLKDDPSSYLYKPSKLEQ